MMQFNAQKQDYDSCLEGNLASKLPDEVHDSHNNGQSVQACHRRGADRCAKVTEMHRGLYVKAAQFVASIRGGTGDRGIPEPYIAKLATFTDQAPHKPAGDMVGALQEALSIGRWPDGPLDGTCTLKELDIEPLAAASLAQVHRGVLQDGSEVAVKVQYPELREEMASDLAVFKTMGSQMKQMTQGYDFMWVVEDFEKYITRELDFKLEAANAELTASQLAHLAPSVYVPAVYWQHTSERVLTMEFCDGLIKANDAEGLRSAGLDVLECARLLCSTFAEMVFIYGRVHADPHAGNIYFRVRSDGDGRERPQLVILDHGLYHDLSESDVRLRFCRYWKACCAKDSRAMSELGAIFAGSLERLLPLLLSPLFVLGGTGVSLSELVAASEGNLPDTVSLTDVVDFVMATRHGGANLCGLLHSLGYIRSLLTALGLPESARVRCMLEFALLGERGSAQVPRELSLRDRSWARWTVGKLNGQVQLLAPAAGLALACRKRRRIGADGALGCCKRRRGAASLV